MGTLDLLFGGGGGGGGGNILFGYSVFMFCLSLFLVSLFWVLVVCSIFSLFRILVVFCF